MRGCPGCGADIDAVRIEPYDFGVDRDTGYHDAGERGVCTRCGFTADITDFEDRSIAQ